MSEYIEWIKLLFASYPAFKYVIVFFASGFGGELAVITLGFLTAQGFLHVAPLLFFSFLGTLFSDVVWFSLGRTKTIGSILAHKYAHGTVMAITETVAKISRGSHLLAMIIAKFLIGTRIVLIMYVAKTGISFKKFITYDSVSVVVWVLVVAPIGYLGGLGFSYLSNLFENIYAGIGFTLLFVFAIIFLQTWFEKMFSKNQISDN